MQFRTRCFSALPLLVFLLPFCVSVALSGCAPNDPEGTLEYVSGGGLRVGLISAPPWVDAESDPADGVEVELAREFSEELNAEVMWHDGGSEELFEKLEKFELDLLLGGLTDKSPWGKRVALTRPYLEVSAADGEKKRHVWALPPGENGFLLRVEHFLESRKERARRLLEEAR